MALPRRNQISLDATPFYHCMTRCVRRAFLCGTDSVTGKNYGYRKKWVEDRLFQLESIFSIRLCAYAIMSNHYHIVICVDENQANEWDDMEVISRWHSLFKGNFVSQKFIKGDQLSFLEQKLLNVSIALWRERLMNVSWFLRCINEYIAKQANNEEGLTGRFWESRFKSQALLDEKAVLSCMAYVDLNPIRANAAATPEESEYTSIKTRITKSNNSLYPFQNNQTNSTVKKLAISLAEYLELVDWSGREIKENKKGFIRHHYPPILDRLGFTPIQWEFTTSCFEKCFKSLVGSARSLKQKSSVFGLQRISGLSACRFAFN